MNRFRFRSRHRCSGARAAAPWLAGAAALLPLAGFLHPVSGADHAVAMVAVGLWGAVLGLAVLAAQIGTASGRALLLVLPIGWLTGVWIGLQLPGEPALPLLTTLSFTLVGLLGALQARLGVRWLAGLALLSGGLHGLVNGATMNHGGGEQLGSLWATSPERASKVAICPD
jgi:urease accessory protein